MSKISKVFVPGPEDILPPDDQHLFATYDLSLSAALLECGYKLARLDRTDPKKVRFLFEAGMNINGVIQKFWDGKLLVDASAYANAVKRLKNQIYSN